MMHHVLAMGSFVLEADIIPATVIYYFMNK
ncbi:Uncharacterised protein [Serratia quinivorans]|nr:Uncharacterised protein [Serratia quinivorans]CAI1742416.1 Uncharacterised protein [Serratia quinivorans]